MLAGIGPVQTVQQVDALHTQTAQKPDDELAIEGKRAHIETKREQER